MGKKKNSQLDPHQQAVRDAYRALEAVELIERSTRSFVLAVGEGEEEIQEILHALERAREWAIKSRQVPTTDLAIDAARGAWAATMTAIEASERINRQIAEALTR